jgi:hypothetical protein
MTFDVNTIADLARAALADAKQLEKSKCTCGSPGSRARGKREPQLAAALLEALGQPANKSSQTSQVARHAGELRLLAEDVGRLHGELRETRFARDRWRGAYLAAYELAVKIAAECADPERIEAGITAALQELRPKDSEDA